MLLFTKCLLNKIGMQTRLGPEIHCNGFFSKLNLLLTVYNCEPKNVKQNYMSWVSFIGTTCIGFLNFGGKNTPLDFS